jgi:Uma2 family endonuclease
MTPEEFDATPLSACDDRYRYELINGVLVVSPLVSDEEADPNEDLGYLLRYFQETHPNGSILDATLPERDVPTSANRRRCDRAIWAGLGRLPDSKKDIPTIVVEFVAKDRRDFERDYILKRDEYLAVGVQEYWIIDRFRRIMTVYRKGAGPVPQVVTESQTYETALLPGFVLPLGRLLSQANRWTKPRPQPRPTRSRKPRAGGTDG